MSVFLSVLKSFKDDKTVDDEVLDVFIKDVVGLVDEVADEDGYVVGLVDEVVDEDVDLVPTVGVPENVVEFDELELVDDIDEMDEIVGKN
jgi:hypothetical protein